MQPGLTERRTHDYVRHGTTTLFAALNIATGTVTARCQPGVPPTFRTADPIGSPAGKDLINGEEVSEIHT
jgi:hypothetical protein